MMMMVLNSRAIIWIPSRYSLNRFIIRISPTQIQTDVFPGKQYRNGFQVPVSNLHVYWDLAGGTYGKGNLDLGWPLGPEDEHKLTAEAERLLCV